MSVGKYRDPVTGEWKKVGGSGSGAAATDPVPSYVRAEAERVAKVVQSRQNANTITFIACSDIHYSSPDNASPITTAAKIKEATTHMGQAMGIIRENVHVDFAAMLGDMVRDSGEASADEILAEVRFVNSCLHDGFSSIPSFRIEGNHEDAYSSGNTLSAGQVFANVHAWNTGVVFGDRAAGYCYRDFEDVRLRVICMNTTEGQSSSLIVSAAQNVWLADALDLSQKGDGWQSVILCHHPLDFDRPDGVDPVPTVSAASGLIGVIHGHIHNFMVDYITGTEVKRIAIPNAVRDQENSYASKPLYDEGTKYTKTAGTAEDTSFCVITIDLADQKIYADHYGAGYSREIKYKAKGVATYEDLVPSSYAVGSDEVYGGDYNGDGKADGYKRDVYASGASEGQDDKFLLTGLIRYDWEHGERRPIYIKDAGIDTSEDRCRIIGFANSSTGVGKTATFQGAFGSALETYFTIEPLVGTDYWMVTPTDSIPSNSYLGWLRFSLVDKDKAPIITINQPIE